MKELRDKVAVVTGAASGIGRELALACAREGMRVVLADIDRNGLPETAGLVERLGAQSVQVTCDVSKAEQVDQLAAQTYERFGAAHLVFNNAGVAVAGPLWTATVEDWQWSLGINLMGVAHGIRSFVPRMLAQKTEGHVVNTASVAGLVSVYGNGVYCATKHAVVTLSECLLHELRREKAAISVSVLCPAFVPTKIFDSNRNRPAELAASNPLAAPYEAIGRKAVQSGKLSAADVAQITLDGVKADRFYIVTHPKILRDVETRMRDILEQRHPTDTLP
ncbi:MAG TPA: SDR family NAD(P)-dependent oxidoreductase [Burkholderiaceae bacterium]|nr:SDR family NAD(P)-dependent oxidoreductase [Burkholderiaceae bacterium]